ncbi:MAG: VanW family protein [Lachnospiraceae bacterium]|nr:VanW family protein [Lachnospiraceae bacterium]
MKSFTKKSIYVLTAILMATLFSVNVSSVNAKEKNVASKKVFVGDTDVSGMNTKEIENVISNEVKVKSKRKVTLKAGKNELLVSGSDLGIQAAENTAKKAVNFGKTGNPLEKAAAKKSIDKGLKKTFNIALKTNAKKITGFLDMHSSSLSNETINNGLKRENGEFVFVKGKAGDEVVQSKAIKKIRSFVENDWDSEKDVISLETHKVMPKGDEKELAKVKDLLGTFTTTYTLSDKNRNANIARAASLLNGRVLYKNDILDVYKAIGPTNTSNGYVAAGVYLDGQIAEGEGGGVCQASTTLYNAAILAELGIENRASHSMLVHYVEPSFDAAIAAGSDADVAIKDLVLKNKYDAPVYIEALTTPTSITVNVYGQETRAKNREVSYENELLEATEIGHKYTADPSLPVGTISKKASGSIGYKARLWKIIKVDGVEQSRKIFNRSTYKMLEEEDAVGVASADPARTQRMIDAINSKNQQTIEDTARALAGEEGTEFKVPQTEKSELLKKQEEDAQKASEGTAPAETPAENPAPAP